MLENSGLGKTTLSGRDNLGIGKYYLFIVLENSKSGKTTVLKNSVSGKTTWLENNRVLERLLY